jgi:hypothetical protein
MALPVMIDASNWPKFTSGIDVSCLIAASFSCDHVRALRDTDRGRVQVVRLAALVYRDHRAGAGVDRLRTSSDPQAPASGTRSPTSPASSALYSALPASTRLTDCSTAPWFHGSSGHLDERHLLEQVEPEVVLDAVDGWPSTQR